MTVVVFPWYTVGMRYYGLPLPVAMVRVVRWCVFGRCVGARKFDGELRLTVWVKTAPVISVCSCEAEWSILGCRG